MTTTPRHRQHAAQQAHASIALVKRTATPPDVAGAALRRSWRDEGFCPVVVTAFIRTLLTVNSNKFAQRAKYRDIFGRLRIVTASHDGTRT